MLIRDVVENFTLLLAYIVDVNDVCECGIVGEFANFICAAFELLGMEMDGFLIVEDCSVKDLGFHEVLEYMTSIG